VAQVGVKRWWQALGRAGLAWLLLSVTACAGGGAGSTLAPEPSLKPTLQAVETQETLAAPPAGITFRTVAGTFVTQAGGEVLQLEPVEGEGEGVAGIPSPDGRYRLVNTAESQAVSDLRIDKAVQVWPQAGMNLCRFEWAPGQPARLVSTLLPAGADPAFSCNLGSPVLLSPDGAQLEILDPSASGISGLSIAPDGQRFAYDVAGIPYIYTFGEGAEPLDLRAYQAKALVEAQLADPAWSGSGRRLAWTFTQAGSDPAQGVVVFDLQARTAKVLGPYEVEAYGATRPRLFFSPDEGYLALRTYDTALGDFSSTILSVDGSLQRPLEGYFGQWDPAGDLFSLERKPGAPGCRLGVESVDGSTVIPICLGDWVIWSPDGGQVLSHPYNRDAFWVTDLVTQETVQVNLPPGAEIVEWREVSGE
jgi:hypothetical protein